MTAATQPTVRPAGLKAPVIRIGVVQWMRRNLFNGVFNSLLTVVVLLLLYKIVPPFV